MKPFSTVYWTPTLCAVLIALQTPLRAVGDEYHQRREAIQARDAQDRKGPRIPAKGERIRCKDIDRDKTFRLLNDRLRRFSQDKQ